VAAYQTEDVLELLGKKAARWEEQCAHFVLAPVWF
jgi:hypothetical protein